MTPKLAERMQPVRVPGAALEAYVVHRGDEIPQQLDHRLHGSSQGLEADLARIMP